MNLTEPIAKKLLPLLALLFFCFMAGFFLYFDRFSPEAKEARRFFELMPVQQVDAVVLEPVPYNPYPLSRGVITITDHEQINRILSLLHSARRCSPNHPRQKWAAILHLEAGRREYSGELTSTSNQGVLFYYGLDTDGGPVYGTYRQDALGPVVEQIVNEHGSQ